MSILLHRPESTTVPAAWLSAGTAVSGAASVHVSRPVSSAAMGCAAVRSMPVREAAMVDASLRWAHCPYVPMRCCAAVTWVSRERPWDGGARLHGLHLCPLHMTAPDRPG